MRWYDWPFSLCLACRVYISTIIIITLVSAKSAPGSHRWLQSRGDRWAEPCAFDVPAGWAVVLFTHITCVIIYPGIPSLCFLALGRDPSVWATLVSYQNFLAPRMVQSLSQNWLHFLWSKCKWTHSHTYSLQDSGPSWWLSPSPCPFWNCVVIMGNPMDWAESKGHCIDIASCLFKK